MLFRACPTLLAAAMCTTSLAFGQDAPSAQPGPSPAGDAAVEELPAELRAMLMTGCAESGNTEPVCVCVVDRVDERYTLADFERGAILPETVAEILAGCLPYAPSSADAGGAAATVAPYGSETRRTLTLQCELAGFPDEVCTCFVSSLESRWTEAQVLAGEATESAPGLLGSCSEPFARRFVEEHRARTANRVRFPAEARQLLVEQCRETDSQEICECNVSEMEAAITFDEYLNSGVPDAGFEAVMVGCMLAGNHGLLPR